MALRHQIGELRADLQEHIAYIERLRTVPEPLADAILSHLRSSPGVSAALSAIGTGLSPGPSRLSERRTAEAVTPTVGSDVLFELAVHHSTTYPALPPTDMTSLDCKKLLSKCSILMSSQSNAAAFMEGQRMDPVEDGTINPQLLVTEIPHPLRGVSATRPSTILGFSQRDQHCDHRLDRLDVYFWTKVPIGNEFAANVISYYLETEHAVTGRFDADLFVGDLVNCRLEYCSAFLVSSLLSLACVSGTCKRVAFVLVLC